MAKITLEIPDDKLQEVVDSLCATYGYQAKILDKDGKEIINPETPAQFAKRQVVQFVKEVVKSSRINKAAAIARETEINKPEISIT